MKDRVNNMNDLHQRIAALEQEQQTHIADLRRMSSELADSVNPVRLAKAAWQKATASPDLRSAVLSTLAGWGAGLITRRLVPGRSGKMLKRVSGAATAFLISRLLRGKQGQEAENI